MFDGCYQDIGLSSHVPDHFSEIFVIFKWNKTNLEKYGRVRIMYECDVKMFILRAELDDFKMPC